VLETDHMDLGLQLLVLDRKGSPGVRPGCLSTGDWYHVQCSNSFIWHQLLRAPAPHLPALCWSLRHCCPSHTHHSTITDTLLHWELGHYRYLLRGTQI